MWGRQLAADSSPAEQDASGGVVDALRQSPRDAQWPCHCSLRQQLKIDFEG